MTSSSGFTLVEIIVTITIIMVFTSMLLVAYPPVRSYQSAQSARQLVQFQLRSLQQRAIHRERDQACVDQLGQINNQNYSRCSEMGLVFQSGQNKVLIMANSSFEGQEGMRLNNQDTVVGEFNLPGGVTAAENKSLLVVATPPNLSLFAGDGLLQEVVQSTSLEINAQGRPNTFYILPYGQVSASEPKYSEVSI